MNHDLKISQSVDIHASILDVWKGLTTPEIIKEYLYGTETITDWKVGSEIIFQGEWEGKQYRDKGVILENEFCKLIKYSYWSGFSGLEDKPENYNLVQYNFTDKGNNITEFTWTQIGFANEQACEHTSKRMKDFLEKIKSTIENSVAVK